MRILITGVTGLLGWNLQRIAKSENKLFGIYYPKRVLEIPLKSEVRSANVADGVEIESIFKWAKPNVVIHTAAIGSVDYAEKNKEYTKTVNVGGTKIITELCERWKSHLVYISSNAVFNGLSPFYSENDEVAPINYYGQLKVEAEKVGIPAEKLVKYYKDSNRKESMIEEKVFKYLKENNKVKEVDPDEKAKESREKKKKELKSKISKKKDENKG